MQKPSSSPETPNPFDALRRARIEHPYQVLLWAPRKFNDFSTLTPPGEFRHNLGQKVVVRVTVTKPAQPASDRSGAPQKGRFWIFATDESGHEHRMTAFGMLRFSPWKSVAPGSEVFLSVQLSEFNGNVYLQNPEIIPPEFVGRVMPVYSGKAGVVAADTVAQGVRLAVCGANHVADAVVAIRQAFLGMEGDAIMAMAESKGTLEQVINCLHRPPTMRHAEWARASASKIAAANIRFLAEKATERPMRIQSSIRIDHGELAAAVATLPYKPTIGERSQASAMRQILDLLAQPYPMDALLTADVGVGKTLTYMVPAVLAQGKGAKVCILVPNTILARQIITEFRECFPQSPVVEVSDGTRKEPIDWTSNPVLVGTSRLFAVAKKAKWHPSLLIIDEQQKMNREQRERLCTRDTNVLEASATPLPQSVALLQYGSKSRIEVDKQHASKQISSRVVTATERRGVLEHIKAMIAAGYQAAVIYPRVEANGGEGVNSVVAAGEKWEEQFPGNVVVIHGKMKNDEKAEAMEVAKSSRKKLVVASSIIEIGVTIPDLRLLLVVEADRYGVSTLHQMRGRLARQGGDGYFYALITRQVEDSTMERLQLLEQTNNGFELAELDMQQRGIGNLLEDMDEESGITRTVFRGIDLMPQDLVKGEAESV